MKRTNQKTTESPDQEEYQKKDKSALSKKTKARQCWDQTSSWEGTIIDAGSWELHAGPRRDKKIKVRIKEFKKESRESRYDLRIRKSTNVDQKRRREEG